MLLLMFQASRHPARTPPAALVAIPVAIMLAAGCSATVERPATPPSPTPTVSSSAVRSAQGAGTTVAENARKGDPGWRLRRRGAEHEIEGFADRVSVLPGQGFRLYVSTTAGRYTARAFRMGWYGGAGARQVWRASGLPGRRQAPPRTVAATGTATVSTGAPAASGTGPGR